MRLRARDVTAGDADSVPGPFGAPAMGNNLVVKVHYALGSRKR